MRLASPIESLVPGLRGRVLGALVRASQPLSLRELSRRAHSPSPSSVKRVVVELMDEGMLQYALVSASSQFFELNRSHLIVGHLMSLDRARDSVLDEIRSAVTSWLREPRAVVLFGSVARGEDTAASDIDLLIVWNVHTSITEGSREECRQLAERVHALTGNTLSIIEFTDDTWATALLTGDPFVNSIARDGLSLTGTSVRALTKGNRRTMPR